MHMTDSQSSLIWRQISWLPNAELENISTENCRQLSSESLDSDP
jgi:hypothetical protein